MADTNTEQFTTVGNGRWRRLLCRHCGHSEPLPARCDIATLVAMCRAHRCKQTR